MILVSKRRKAALLSSRRTFTWKPAREFKGREHRFVPAAVMRRKPNYRAGPGGRGGAGTRTVIHAGVVAGELHPVASLILQPPLQGTTLSRALPCQEWGSGDR